MPPICIEDWYIRVRRSPPMTPYVIPVQSETLPILSSFLNGWYGMLANFSGTWPVDGPHDPVFGLIVMSKSAIVRIYFELF
jgi:hypothetical protein